MKILVVSDTHRNMEKMTLAIEKEKPDLVLHLGDHDADAEALSRQMPFLSICYVKGNCDSFSDSPIIYEHSFQGIQIFATHGHKYNVKNGLLPLQYAAMERGANVALFGHTHCAYCQEHGGLWMMNPGTCGGYRASYGLVEIENGRVNCRIVEGEL